MSAYDQLVPKEFQPKALSARYVKALQKAWKRASKGQASKVRVLKSESIRTPGWEWGNYTLLECFPLDGSESIRAAVTLNAAEAECTGIVDFDSPYRPEPVRRDRDPSKVEASLVAAIAKVLLEPMTKTATAQASRVASRFLQAAAGIGEGHTLQNPKVRIHRYRPGIEVTDLTFAGKRGKTCDQAYFAVEREAADILSRAMALKAAGGYRVVLEAAAELDYTPELRKLKGISVEPFGDRFEFKWTLPSGTDLELRASPLDWSLRDSALMKGPSGKPAFRQDTLYWPRSKQDAQVFYRWVLDNSTKVKGMTLQEFRDLWQALGVRYDSH